MALASTITRRSVVYAELGTAARAVKVRQRPLAITTKIKSYVVNLIVSNGIRVIFILTNAIYNIISGDQK